MSEYVAVKIFPVQVCHQYEFKALVYFIMLSNAALLLHFVPTLTFSHSAKRQIFEKYKLSDL